MKRTLISLALVAAGLVGAASPLLFAEPAQATSQAAAYGVPDPARQLTDLARLFRRGDVAALVQAAVPPARWEEARAKYELVQLADISEHDRAEFAENVARFTAPDAVDRLMEEIEPKLEEARPQLPGALLMGTGALQMAIGSPESKLTASQREALESALPGISEWAFATDFLSSATLREALTLMVEAARQTGVNDLDQLKALPLEAVLDRASLMLAAGKKAVKLYGIDLDQVADSLRVDVLELDGETAKVRTTITVFNAPVWVDHDLVLVEGRWYGKDMARHWREQHDIEMEVAATADVEG